MHKSDSDSDSDRISVHFRESKHVKMAFLNPTY